LFFYFLQGAALSLSAALMPGPFQAYLLSQALKLGWKRTLPAALAPLASDGPIIALVLIALTQIPIWLLEAIQIAGGVFILYLARRMVATLRDAQPLLEPQPATRETFTHAVIINVLNPNPYLWWSVIGAPIVLEGWRESPTLGIAFLAGFYGLFICILAALIVLFASAGKLDERVNKVLKVFAALALLTLGLYQIVTGLMKFL
jgi:threonine/homoserine/homoserine lactone efflux protein